MAGGDGLAGRAGMVGTAGTSGTAGTAGTVGTDGTAGTAGTDGTAGTAGQRAEPSPTEEQPLAGGVPGPAVPAFAFPLHLAIVQLVRGRGAKVWEYSLKGETATKGILKPHL